MHFFPPCWDLFITKQVECRALGSGRSMNPCKAVKLPGPAQDEAVQAWECACARVWWQSSSHRYMGIEHVLSKWRELCAEECHRCLSRTHTHVHTHTLTFTHPLQLIHTHTQILNWRCGSMMPRFYVEASDLFLLVAEAGATWRVWTFFLKGFALIWGRDKVVLPSSALYAFFLNESIQ